MDKYVGDKKERQVHHKLFPSTFRMLIVGPSGAGKTCLLMKMLLEDGLLNYDNLYVFARSLYQHQYQCLMAGFEHNLPKKNIITLLNSHEYMTKNSVELNDIAQTMREVNDEKDIEPNHINAQFFESSDEIPDPKDLEKKCKNLIIFDDIMDMKKQITPESYYTRGRSANCDCIYLSQNYTHLPLHTIRSNSNFMVFFKSSPMVIDQLHRNFSSVDMGINEWRKFCNSNWIEDYGYIVIDLSRSYRSGNKYRSNINLV